MVASGWLRTRLADATDQSRRTRESDPHAGDAAHRERARIPGALARDDGWAVRGLAPIGWAGARRSREGAPERHDVRGQDSAHAGPDRRLPQEPRAAKRGQG